MQNVITEFVVKYSKNEQMADANTENPLCNLSKAIWNEINYGVHPIAFYLSISAIN